MRFVRIINREQNLRGGPGPIKELIVVRNNNLSLQKKYMSYIDVFQVKSGQIHRDNCFYKWHINGEISIII